MANPTRTAEASDQSKPTDNVMERPVGSKPLASMADPLVKVDLSPTMDEQPIGPASVMCETGRSSAGTSSDLVNWGPLARALAAAERPIFQLAPAPQADAVAGPDVPRSRRVRLAVAGAALMLIALGGAVTWAYARFRSGQG
jgi:hypothetical protein